MKVQQFHPSTGRIPIHVGLIPDGARRWAKKSNIVLLESYRKTMKLLVDILLLLYSRQTKIVSIYFSSIHNFKRSESEIISFCKAESVFCSDYLSNYVRELDVKVIVVGNINVIPDFFKKSIIDIERNTINHSKKILFLCVAYDPLEEIYCAFKEAKKTSEFTEKLWIPYPIDLIIRSGGANLISNFLPIQSGFARLYFKRKLFNDFTLIDIENILNDFSLINRTYGD